MDKAATSVWPGCRREPPVVWACLGAGHRALAGTTLAVFMRNSTVTASLRSHTRYPRDYLSTANRPFYQGGQKKKFDGCDGLGASTVLATVAETVTSARFTFDIVIRVDCSA